MLVVALCHLRFDPAQFGFICCGGTLKPILGIQLPVEKHEHDQDDHRPAGQLIWWDREQDGDEDDPGHRDPVQDCAPAFETPRRSFRSGKFALLLHPVAYIQIDRDGIRKV